MTRDALRFLLALLVSTVPVVVATGEPAPAEPAIAQPAPDAVPPKPIVAETLIDLSDRAEASRAANGAPALALAWIRDGQVVGAGAAGVRKEGAPERVTVNDQWHLGSCTKAMTATLAGILVEKGALRWETTIGQTIPEIANDIDPSYKSVTLAQLLSHRSGLPADQSPSVEQSLIWTSMRFGDGDLASRRMTGVKFGLKQRPIGAPGEKFAYSNLGYTVAGVMLERAAGDTYENLMAREIFGPLGMTSAGWGPPGAPEAINEPWGHDRVDDKLVPISPAMATADNPPAIAPAGTVHATIIDWAKFVVAHVRDGQGDLLASPRIFTVLHTPMGDNYAMGWIVTERPWAKGEVLMHNGSNSHWYAVVWAAPGSGSAYLATCNAADEKAMTACDQAITSLILNPPGPSPAPVAPAVPEAPH